MYKNREEAGLLLAQKLKDLKEANPLALSIPRGGVMVGDVIAKTLNLSHDILIIKKIGAPSNPELAIGAVGPKGVVYWEEELCGKLGISKSQKLRMRSEKSKEVEEREKLLREGKSSLKVKDRTIILVDDGVATGATVMAAYKFLKKEKAGKIILAVPVIAKETFSKIREKFDKVIVLQIPEYFSSVGQFYQEFPQVEDEEVISILEHRG